MPSSKNAEPTAVSAKVVAVRSEAYRTSLVIATGTVIISEMGARTNTIAVNDAPNVPWGN